MMGPCSTKNTVLGVLFATIAAANLAIGAEIPLIEDFSDSDTPFVFSSSSPNVTAVVADGVLTVDSALGTGSQALNVLTSVSNAAETPIIMSTEIKLTAWAAPGGGSSTGFLAFATNPENGVIPSGPNSGYLADIVFPLGGSAAHNGYIRILDAANAHATIVESKAIPFAAGSLALDETYQLTFSAKPAPGGLLDFSLTLTDTLGTLIDEDGVVTITGTSPAAASTGTFFGLRHRVGNSSGTAATRTLDAVYDNFSILPIQSGDFDGDGDVDGADFVAWQTNFPTASNANTSQGDADGDGDVDGADFGAWQSGFPASASSQTSPVPEPSGMFLASAAVLAFVALSKRRPIASLSS